MSGIHIVYWNYEQYVYRLLELYERYIYPCWNYERYMHRLLELYERYMHRLLELSRLNSGILQPC
jgi:hypothetical protein